MIEFNINRILVPVDFGAASINALDTAIAMAKRHDAAILLLNIVETGTMPNLPENNYFAGETVNKRIRNSEQELQLLQDSIMERFLVSCEAICATGAVSSSIIKISTDRHADIIVMGTNGESGIKGLLIGSNAYNVVKDSVCPVLTIPPERKWDSFRKILFPVRPIAAALEKYDFLRKIIRKNEATLKILGLATDYEREVDFLKDLATQLNEKLKEDEVKASTYFKVGNNMADEVLKIAALMDADLIVITATIESSFKQFFIGPYTQHIINHSRFPVLSIKPSFENEQAELPIQRNSESLTREMPLYN